MKLLNSVGPNPRKVRMFLHEKGIELPLEEVDLFGGENRRPPYTERNPAGQVPSLELDDGTLLGETVAICEYLEELNPDTPLIGSNAKERAETRMWLRRVELNITEFAYAGFRYAEGLDLFRERLLCLPEAADGMKRKARAGMEWIDQQLTGRQFLCGEGARAESVLGTSAGAAQRGEQEGAGRDARCDGGGLTSSSSFGSSSSDASPRSVPCRSSTVRSLRRVAQRPTRA